MAIRPPAGRVRSACGAGNPDAKLTIVVGVEDEDAERLQQLAAHRHQRPAEVVADLLRSA